jgi:hypothetical protein
MSPKRGCGWSAVWIVLALAVAGLIVVVFAPVSYLPAANVLAWGYLAYKLVARPARPMAPAFGVLAAVEAVPLIQVLANRQLTLGMLPGPLIAAAGLAWLLWRPGWRPVLLLVALEAVTIGLYVTRSSATLNQDAFMALTLYLLLRVIGILLLFVGLNWVVRQKKAAAQPASTMKG